MRFSRSTSRLTSCNLQVRITRPFIFRGTHITNKRPAHLPIDTNSTLRSTPRGSYGRHNKSLDNFLAENIAHFKVFKKSPADRAIDVLRCHFTQELTCCLRRWFAPSTSPNLIMRHYLKRNPTSKTQTCFKQGRVVGGKR